MKNKKNRIIYDKSEKWILSLSKNTQRFDCGKNPKKDSEERFYILTNDPDFLKEAKRIRVSFDIPNHGFKNDQDAIRWAKKIYNNKKINLLKKEVKNLFPERISPRWYPAIEYYLLFNKTNAEHLFPPPLDFWIEERDREYVIMLKILKGTTQKDIIKVLPEIEKQKRIIGKIDRWKIKDNKEKFNEAYTYSVSNGSIIKIKPSKDKRFGSYKNFLKYKKAFELRKKGKTYEEIAKEIESYKSDSPKTGTYIKRFKEALKENTLP